MKRPTEEISPFPRDNARTIEEWAKYADHLQSQLEKERKKVINILNVYPRDRDRIIEIKKLFNLKK